MLKEMEIFDIKTPTYSKGIIFPLRVVYKHAKGQLSCQGLESQSLRACVCVNIQRKYMGKRYSSPQAPKTQTHCFSDFPRNLS